MNTTTAQKVEWELITDGAVEYTERLRVPGGWIYCRTAVTPRDASPMAMVFVPAAPDIHEGREEELLDERVRHRAEELKRDETPITDEDLPWEP